MTLDKLRDWHYQREGWRWVDGSDGPGWFESRDGRKSRYDPFPATLDAADASFPPRWRWERVWTDQRKWWAAYPEVWDGSAVPIIDDTGDKIHDLYELSKLAWEQEAA